LLNCDARFVRELIHQQLVGGFNEPKVIFGVEIETCLGYEGGYKGRILQETMVDDR
jgi:hypothetical protein